MLKFQNIVLELIARGKPLEQTLVQLCLEMEELIADASVMVCSVDSAGMMHLLAAPGIPESYGKILDGTVVGPEVGSCGSAIYHNAAVSVADIENDPKWATYKKCVLPFGLLACSSVPIRNETGEVVGALAVYFSKSTPRRHKSSK
ncbi:hypothetical protein DEA98_21600 [Brucella pseudogrignonensis]|nr:hypothetical protein [Brucella pseudogrignonensis]NKX16794.1 GAF domain-containing protein [Brucella pseudogrignonensis]